MNELLNAVKIALRITVDAYDTEITSLINAALADLGIVGIEKSYTDALIVQAIKTYVRMNFGSPSDYDRLKRAYDEQKAQMQSATGYGL